MIGGRPVGGLLDQVPFQIKGERGNDNDRIRKTCKNARERYHQVKKPKGGILSEKVSRKQ